MTIAYFPQDRIASYPLTDDYVNDTAAVQHHLRNSPYSAYHTVYKKKLEDLVD